jgi:hypothetical protein
MLQTRSNERRWELMSHLNIWPGEARAFAFELLRSRGIVQRMDGAELMGALCALQPDHIDEFAPALVEAFDGETDEDLLSFVLFSLHQAIAHEGEKPPVMIGGEWQVPPGSRRRRPVQPLVWELMADDRAGRFERIASLAKHENPARREAVAKSLEDFIGLDPRVIDMLVKLTTDPDVGPREWATHALASSPLMLELPEANDRDITDALWERLFDREPAIRNEAAYGFVLRHDPRSTSILERQLLDDEVTLLLAQAARELADPALVPLIQSVLEWWPAEGGDAWQVALRACRKNRATAPSAPSAGQAPQGPSAKRR